MIKKDMKNKNNQFKGIVLSILIVLMFLFLPLGVIVGAGIALPNQYENTFTAALPDKMDRLCEIKKPKIIVIGGSSIAFGLDSKLMENLTGMPVINFGLYASLGTRVMLDLSKANINKGDIIILSPETDDQTLSMYFNPEVMWQAIERDKSILKHLPRDLQKEMLLAFRNYSANKSRLFLSGTPNPVGVYRRDSFDKYGDIVYSRPQSQMKLGYDPGQPINPTKELISNGFIDYVNDYIKHAKSKGATVYFTFSPMNESAMSEEVTSKSLYDYYRYLSNVLDCEVISDINNSILEAGYFYDSNFHLNDSGKVVWTAGLSEDIRRIKGITTPLGIELPVAPEIPKDGPTTDEDDPNAVYFTYKEIKNNKGEIEWYSVSGLSDEGLTKKSLIIPKAYNKIPVHSIEANAFKSSQVLEELTINDNIYSIASGAFADCPKLVKLHIYNDDASNMAVDQISLFDGANPNLKIYLYSQESYESYVSGYFWANYAGKMVLVKD